MLSFTNNGTRVALTGFMGVGKSSVARHLSMLLDCGRVDLDSFIEEQEGRKIHEIINADGLPFYRQVESRSLRLVLTETDAQILSLGGGTWTVSENRRVLKRQGLTSVWLESSFQHCWRNIRMSKKERPLATNKAAARALFDERQKLYALADWHFVIKPEFTSYDIARQIAEQIFS
ncbi:MAG TPA: shikimate kinase [Pyrinomonadaceae bacterium]|nr:shikimate kinase [Pyrinomonadaceae bacterium]